MASTENSKMPDSSPTPKSMKTEYRLVINISHKWKISICKPLIPLKIALTLWYAASMGMAAYITLFFKQRGLTVEEISFMYLTAYLSQFVVNTACGVASDKIGRPAYMTVLSILITGSLTFCLTFIPKVGETVEENLSFSSLYCDKTDYARLQIHRTCDNIQQIMPCEEMCTQECCRDISLRKLNLIDKFANHSAFSFNNGSQYDLDWCFRDSKTVLFANDAQYLCGVYQKACTVTCSEYKSGAADRKSRVLFLIAIVVLLLTFDENTYRFLDILANCMANSFEAEYGKQIFWSNTGALIGPSLVALIIQQTSTSEEVLNYESSLYFYAAVALLTIATVCTLDVRKGKPAQEMSRAAIKLLKNVDFLFFVFILFVLGGTWGFLMNFHNLFLADIGTPIYMMGLLDTFAGICGLPVLVTGKWLTDKIGNTNIFNLALLGYFFKCFGYSFLRVAWPAFFLELLMAFSYHLLWVATIDFCTKIGPEDLRGTMVTLAGSVHFSLGRACGSFAGGLLMSAYGASAAFQVIGAANGVAFLLYSMFQFLRKTRRVKKLDIS
ncbi:hypothetical protein AVEN_153127-1 [Araneus ventricosus]|uniref:Major facilitator superfamily (MFS) profile domain-containing protein n=1 Tax=Araneus ventricosus TaxID=182803 RepID=A0A4Y2IGK5_ARAVE|nr:hypothetical protein AVEN_153127-1 [Araneus ventricosus]